MRSVECTEWYGCQYWSCRQMFLIIVAFAAVSVASLPLLLFFFLPATDGVDGNFALIFHNTCNTFNALSLFSCSCSFGWFLYHLFSPSISGVNSTAAKTTVLVLFPLLYFIFCSSLTLTQGERMRNSYQARAVETELVSAQEMHFLANCCSYITNIWHKYLA